jgi:hypothetical protein
VPPTKVLELGCGVRGSPSPAVEALEDLGGGPSICVNRALTVYLFMRTPALFPSFVDVS